MIYCGHPPSSGLTLTARRTTPCSPMERRQDKYPAADGGLNPSAADKSCGVLPPFAPHTGPVPRLESGDRAGAGPTIRMDALPEEQKTPETTEIELRKDRPTTDLARPDDVAPQSSLLGFFEPAQVGRAFVKSGWAIEDEIEALVSMAKGRIEVELGYEEPPSHKIRLDAIRELRRLSKESLEVDGRIVHTNQHRQIIDEDGNPVNQHVESMRLKVFPALEQTAKLLDEGVLDEEDPNTDAEPPATEPGVAAAGEPTNA